MRSGGAGIRAAVDRPAHLDLAPGFGVSIQVRALRGGVQPGRTTAPRLLAPLPGEAAPSPGFAPHNNGAPAAKPPGNCRKSSCPNSSAHGGIGRTPLVPAGKAREQPVSSVIWHVTMSLDGFI